MGSRFAWRLSTPWGACLLATESNGSASAGQEAVASHRTAAALFGLGEVKPGLVEITMPVARRAPRGVLVHRMEPIANCDKAGLGPLIVTTVARTLIDLGAVVDGDTLEVALEDALTRRLTSRELLERRLADLAGQGRKGPSVIKELLRERYPGNWRFGSTLEVKILQVLRRHDHLPLPIPQFKITNRGRLVQRVDFAYPQVRLIVECESYEHHSEREPWYKDVRRFNEVASLGWFVIRAASEDVTDPSHLIREISMRFDSNIESNDAQFPNRGRLDPLARVRSGPQGARQGTSQPRR